MRSSQPRRLAAKPAIFLRSVSSRLLWSPLRPPPLKYDLDYEIWRQHSPDRRLPIYSPLRLRSGVKFLMPNISCYSILHAFLLVIISVTSSPLSMQLMVYFLCGQQCTGYSRRCAGVVTRTAGALRPRRHSTICSVYFSILVVCRLAYLQFYDTVIHRLTLCHN